MSLFQFIISTPPLPIQVDQKVITINSPDEGSATAALINTIKKDNPGIKFNATMVAELDPEVFLKNLSLVKPSVMNLKLEEEKSKLTKTQQLECWAKMLKENGYSVRRK